MFQKGPSTLNRDKALELDTSWFPVLALMNTLSLLNGLPLQVNCYFQWRQEETFEVFNIKAVLGVDSMILWPDEYGRFQPYGNGGSLY